MAREVPAKDKLSCPLWMLTYGDLVTQVLCFFVMLAAISNLDVAKVEAIMRAMRQDWFREEVVQPPRKTIFEQGFDPEKPGATIPVSHKGVHVGHERVHEGLKFTLWGEGLFDEGTAKLKEDAYPIIDAIVENYARGWLNKVEVRGHCSTSPSRDERYPDHWDLSYARAKVTLVYMIGSIEDRGVEPFRIRASAASTFERAVPNYTPEQRAQNDRVEIVILEELAKPD